MAARIAAAALDAVAKPSDGVERGPHNPWTFGIALAACVILAAALLTTRTARVVLRSIRKRLST